jgi:3-isopropylmalate/(R)-2-methylmalate dehydratase large subunit
MGYTSIEKIIMSNAKLNDVKANNIVTVNVDKAMIHDIFIPFVQERFHEMGFKKVWDPSKVVLIYDHMVPASRVEDIRHFKIGDEFAEKYGINNVHRSDGICHQLMVEAKYVRPGDIVFGTDSHTTTYGSIGAFSSGIGYTEMAAVLGTGNLWVKVPETIKITVDGNLPNNVMSKDVILRIIGDLGADGANYKALEFHGTTVDKMSMESRMTMANMAVEAGAKAAIFIPSKETADHYGMLLEDMPDISADEDATYALKIEYKAEDLVPVLACPPSVDKIKPVSDLYKTPIDQVFIGSCTNGRLEDLRLAAKVLEGKKKAKHLRLIVTPASRKVYQMASKDGTLDTLAKAGAIITHPGCGLCCGRSGGILAEGERIVATNNRNFLGRMGPASAEIYLSSPLVAAASAIKGYIDLP